MSKDEAEPVMARMKALRKSAKGYLDELISSGHHEANPNITIEDLVMSDFTMNVLEFVEWVRDKTGFYGDLSEAVEGYEEECREAIRWAMERRGVTEGDRVYKQVAEEKIAALTTHLREALTRQTLLPKQKRHVVWVGVDPRSM